jgi:tetratricopeptide (TPR) repeat protein
MPEGLSDLERELKRDPRSRKFFDLAREYQKAGRLEEALKLCASGLQNHPNMAQARVLHGQLLLASGDIQGSRAAIEKALLILPDNVAANHIAAEVFFALGDSDKALKHYQIVRLFDPAREGVAEKIHLLSAKSAPLQEVVPSSEVEAILNPLVAPAPPVQAPVLPPPPPPPIRPPQPVAIQAPPTAPPAGAGPVPDTSPLAPGALAPEPIGAPESPIPAPPPPLAPQEPQAEAVANRAETPAPFAMDFPTLEELEGPVPVPAAVLQPPSTPVPSEVPHPPAPPEVELQPAFPSAGEPELAFSDLVPPEGPSGDLDEGGELGEGLLDVGVPFEDEILAIPGPPLIPVPPPAAPTTPIPMPAPKAPAPSGPSAAGESMSTVTLARLYEQQGYPEKAIEVYQRLLIKDPDDQEILARIQSLRDQMERGAVEHDFVDQEEIQRALRQRRIRALNDWLRHLREERHVS